MHSAKRKEECGHEEELLVIAHEAELEALTSRYDAQIAELNAEHAREAEALRQRSAKQLVRIVADFETARAASLARLQTRRAMLGQSLAAVGAGVGRA